MTIAAILSIGPLDKYGYQHVYAPCVASIAAFADAVYITQTTRNRAGVDMLLAAHDNIVYTGDESTWFEMRDCCEYYDLWRIRDNNNASLERAKKDGHDIAVKVEVNQYIPEAARKPLGAVCDEVLRTDAPFAWLHRRDQLAGVTFHASLKRAFVLNLHHEIKGEIPDGALYNGLFIKHERGNWPEHDAAAIVDAPMEMSLADLRDKIIYTRGYRELCPKRPAGFDWSYWRSYYIAKFRAKEYDDAQLDIYGQVIASVSAHHPEFISHEILREL